MCGRFCAVLGASVYLRQFDSEHYVMSGYLQKLRKTRAKLCRTNNVITRSNNRSNPFSWKTSDPPL
ncbi:hypothetical protein SAMN05216264_105315 [Pseudomonas marincola]|nr:hypothetical protein SAMN05216264_105315 [Pseudomonas marincola]